MSSIMTNASAMTALKSLQMTNKSLESTQARISTGFRVAQASDNAAYWSIATTMRSDNRAMSTVQDALGLGAAQVDVAYTAMEATKDTLDTIKTKLVAASQPGVDKVKIQSEITQLQQSLESIAGSANFSGSNWLSVDSAANGYSATASIVSSFTRGEGNAISLSTIDIDITKLALFDKSGAGLLQQATGNTASGTLSETGTSGVTTVNGEADDGTAATLTTGTLGITTAAANETLTFSLDIAGETQAISIDLGVAGAKTASAIATLITAELTAGNVSGFTVTGDDTADTLTFTTVAKGADSSVEITAVGGTATPTGTVAAAGPLTGSDTGGSATSGTALMNGTFDTANPIVLDDDDAISFTIDIDGTFHDITIDKATVATTAGLGTAGSIGTAAEMVAVLTKAFANANLTVGSTANTDDINITVNAGGKIEFASNTTGADSKIAVSALRSNSGSADFDILELDITTANADQLAAFTQGVDDMLGAVTTAASDLGAVKSRISMQEDFVANLMSAVERGVGALVDADMNEESTRLQALQVQQQLGIQALSIANGNAQQILALFQ